MSTYRAAGMFCVLLLLGAIPGWRALAGVVAEARTVPKNGTLVLMYHRVADPSPREAADPEGMRWTVRPSAFESQVTWLVRHHYRFVSTRQIVEALHGGQAVPGPAVAVTFDDGYEDNFVSAWPVLRRWNVPATIYLVSGTIGTPRHLGWDQIHKMQASGVTFGAHTVHHSHLPELDPARLDGELVTAREALRMGLGAAPIELAYPYGEYSDSVVEHARAAGYLAAWTMRCGLVRSGEDAYRLPRMEVPGGWTLQAFAAHIKRPGSAAK